MFELPFETMKSPEEQAEEQAKMRAASPELLTSMMAAIGRSFRFKVGDIVMLKPGIPDGSDTPMGIPYIIVKKYRRCQMKNNNPLPWPVDLVVGYMDGNGMMAFKHMRSALVMPYQGIPQATEVAA
jgi:hypothetical protein